MLHRLLQAMGHSQEKALMRSGQLILILSEKKTTKKASPNPLCPDEVS